MASGETSKDKSTTEGSPENLCMFYTTRSLDLSKGSARRSWLIYLGRWLRTNTFLCLAMCVLLMHNKVAENSTQLNFAKSQTGNKESWKNGRWNWSFSNFLFHPQRFFLSLTHF